MVVYLVRSFRTYARIRSLTTGTFNLVVKDRIAFRLSGAPSGLDGPAFLGEPNKSESGCPRNPTNIQLARNPVNPRIPQYFHAFSTLGKAVGVVGGRGAYGSKARNGMAFRFGHSKHRFLGARFSRNTAAEDRKLRKDPNGGPCFEGTLQKPTSCFRIKSRGRDDLRTLHSLKT